METDRPLLPPLAGEGRDGGAVAGGRAPRLLDRVCDALRLRHYSYRTEEAYVGWIRRYILFHRKRHPAEMS